MAVRCSKGLVPLWRPRFGTSGGLCESLLGLVSCLFSILYSLLSLLLSLRDYSVDRAGPSVLPQKRQQQLPKDSANVLSYAPWGAHPGSRASAAETRAETDEGARADELSKDYRALRT